MQNGCCGFKRQRNTTKSVTEDLAHFRYLSSVINCTLKKDFTSWMQWQHTSQLGKQTLCPLKPVLRVHQRLFEVDEMKSCRVCLKNEEFLPKWGWKEERDAGGGHRQVKPSTLMTEMIRSYRFLMNSEFINEEPCSTPERLLWEEQSWNSSHLLAEGDGINSAAPKSVASLKMRRVRGEKWVSAGRPARTGADG